MNWVSPLLPVDPPKVSGRLVTTDDEPKRRIGQRGPDRVKRRTKMTPAVLAKLAELHAERLVALEMYSAESVAKRLGISRAAVFKAWAELKK